MIRLVDQTFGGNSYSLSDLFLEQAAKTMDLIVSRKLQDNPDSFQTFTWKSEAIQRLVTDSAFGEPEKVVAAAHFTINGSLNSQLEKLYGPCLLQQLDTLIECFNSWNIPPEVSSPEKLIRARILFLLRQVEENPQQEALLSEIASLLNLCRNRNIQPELAEAQAILLHTSQSSAVTASHDLTVMFQELAELLRVSIPQTKDGP